jgi:tetratricopeptide (TPR) repeat protein
VPVAAPPNHVDVKTQIISPSIAGTEAELLLRGERALLEQKWKDAAEIFETLVASAPDATLLPMAIFDLGAAYEGLGKQAKARDRFLEVATRFPEGALARTALLRGAAMDAYLEEWGPLGAVANIFLARSDLDEIDRMSGLAARGLSKIEAGEDMSASRDIQDGLDIAEAAQFGTSGRLPPAAAELRFALGEIRRVRSERITFVNLEHPGVVPADFLIKIEMRAQGLLDAQSSYADAMRSIDPHWIAMSSYRVGEMYRSLHRDLMAIPPTDQAKSDYQKQIFFGIMHIRYRVLLEKGLEMMKRTAAMGESQADSSAWVRRAEAAKAEIEIALLDERAAIARYPFTEDELQKALDIMEKKVASKPGQKPVEKPYRPTDRFR